MKTNNFNPNDSIKTIEEALQQTKSEKTGASFYYVIWGILLLVHYLLLFLVTKFPELKGGLLGTAIWSVFPIGGLLSYFRNKKDTKSEKIVTHYERVYLYAFGGFALANGVVFMASAFVNPTLSIALFPLLLGFTVFVTGGITKHTASLVGGVLGIICAGISLNTSLEFQYLFAALSSLIACVIPGFLMKNSNV
jgi:hypothetical protein